MKFDQDLCLNLQYDFGKMNSTLGSVVPLEMFSNFATVSLKVPFFLKMAIFVDLEAPFLSEIREAFKIILADFFR